MLEYVREDCHAKVWCCVVVVMQLLSSRGSRHAPAMLLASPSDTQPMLIPSLLLNTGTTQAYTLVTLLGVGDLTRECVMQTMSPDFEEANREEDVPKPEDSATDVTDDAHRRQLQAVPQATQARQGQAQGPKDPSSARAQGRNKRNARRKQVRG